MCAQDRHVDEEEFWDKHTLRILEDSTYDYKIKGLQGHAGLFDQIEYLRPVVEFFGDIRGKRALDIACGDGWISLSLAKSGARVEGFDISAKRVELAKRYAKANGLDHTLRFKTAVCEEMDYEDNYFDFAIMHAALHHCDIGKTADQIRRVLKPGGKAVLIEDYAYHPLMRFYRVLTPDKHTKFEKALTDDDLTSFVSRFSSHHYMFYGLLNIFETCNSRLIGRVRPILASIDGQLYKALPFLKRFSKLICIYVVK